MTHRTIISMILTAILWTPAASFADVTNEETVSGTGQYLTYSWNEPNDDQIQAMTKIRQQVETEMNALGFEWVDEGGDLIVNVDLSAEPQTRVYVTEIDPRFHGPHFHGPRFHGRRWHRWGWGHELVRMDTQQVTAGVLGIDVKDAETGATVWSESKDGLVRKSAEKNAKKAAKAVGKMFRDFSIEDVAIEDVAARPAD